MTAKAPHSHDLFVDVGTADRFDVREVTIDDGLCALFSIRVVALCDDGAVDFETIIGRPVAFRIDRARRAWTGIVSEIHQLDADDDDRSTYAISIVPRAWLLTQRTSSRVFQHKSDLEAALTILADGAESPIVEVGLELKTREVRVQSQESDFAFVSRMLEGEGLTFFFRTVEGVSRMVITDAPERATRREGVLPFVAKPAEGSAHATQLRASRLAQEIARSPRITFATNAGDLAPGMVLGIGGHPRAEAMGDLLVTRTMLRAQSQSPPSLTCEAVATSEPFRPVSSPRASSAKVQQALGLRQSNEDRKITIERNDREHITGNQSSTVMGKATQTVQGDAIQQVLGSVASFAGGQRMLGTAKNFTSQAAVHTIVSDQATVITVGSSTLYIGPDGVILQAAKILVNPGEEALATAVLTGSLGPAGGGE